MTLLQHFRSLITVVSTAWANKVDIRRVDTLADLRGIPVDYIADGDQSTINCTTTPGDGGAGNFRWDASSADADDGFATILPTGYAGTGRWKRIYVGDKRTDTGAVTFTLHEYNENRILNLKTDFGAVIDGATDDGSTLALASTALSAGGRLIVPKGTTLTGSTFTIPSISMIEGFGNSSVLKLKDTSNVDVIKTSDFSTLTGSNKWFVDTEGVPYGFSLSHLRIDGNKANQASGDGVKIYGKRYIIDDVLIHDVKGVGFYTECAYKGGQHDYRDMPESHIGPLWVYASGSHNVQIRGPHDALFTSIFSSQAGGDGVRVESDGSTYLGTVDVKFIHSYAATAYGFYTNVEVRIDRLIGETCVKEGAYFDSAASDVRVEHLELFNNDSGDSGTYYNLNCLSAETLIGFLRIENGNTSAGGAKFSGNSVNVETLMAKDTNATASAVGVDLDSDYSSIKGEILNWNGTDATGLRTGNTSAASRIDVEMLIYDCYTGWNNVTAGNGGFYKIRIETSNKDHLLFTGAGPSTYTQSTGGGTGTREKWDVIGANSGTSHSGTALAGGAATITLALAGQSTRDDVFNGCIITTTGGTGTGQERVVSDYVGSTGVATVTPAWTVVPDATTTYTMSSLTLRSVSNGTATVANGTTSVTVPHGLLITSVTPTVRNLSIWPTNNSGTASEFWVSAVDKYTFTITVDADPGAGTATFGWEANLTP